VGLLADLPDVDIHVVRDANKDAATVGVSGARKLRESISDVNTAATVTDATRSTADWFDMAADGGFDVTTATLEPVAGWRAVDDNSDGMTEYSGGDDEALTGFVANGGSQECTDPPGQPPAHEGSRHGGEPGAY
jgi:hypothetical protein